MSRPIEENSQEFNPVNTEYFNTLPAHVQEAVIYAAGEINSEEALKEAVQKLMNK